MRRWLLGLGTLIVLGLVAWGVLSLFWRAEAPIRVGILHSKTGPLEISERSLIDAEVMALNEINAQGGIRGRKVEWVIADGRSDPKVFAQEARRLIETEKVCVIFGCLTGSCRKSVKAVVEGADHLLVFPSNYEGMDLPSSVVCTGPLPNQQVIPAVNWCSETLRAKKFFLAGCSADTWSLVSNAIVKDQLKAIGAMAVGEKYVSLDGKGVPELVAAIKAASPDAVLSTVLGDANKPFFQQMAQAGLGPARLPVISFAITEDELRELPVKEMVGDYAAWNYFQSIGSPVNRAFVARFKQRCGAERPTSDAIVAAYNGVKLWAQAVEETGTETTTEVRKAMRRQSLEAPEGVVSTDSENLHTWRPFYLGKIRGDGQFDIVWSLEKPVRPVPYPVLRSRADWDAFVEKLFTSWSAGEFNPQTGSDPPGPSPAFTRRPAAIAATTTRSPVRLAGPAEKAITNRSGFQSRRSAR
jgi:urea transport system substrate-binding protein